MLSRNGLTAGLWALLLLLPGGALAQSLTISVNPVMVKGPMHAPVIVVEFSDYQ